MAALVSLLMILIPLVSLVGSTAWTQTPPDEPSPATVPSAPFQAQSISSVNRKTDAIEVFAGGRRYSSFHEYQLKRVKDELAHLWADSSDKDFDTFRTRLRNEFFRGRFNDLTEKEFLDALEALRPESQGIFSQTQEGGIVQMREMLEDYLKENRVSDSVAVDPSKVKTIVVNPSVNAPVGNAPDAPSGLPPAQPDQNKKEGDSASVHP